jgi:D-amino-acid dehydrogenase
MHNTISRTLNENRMIVGAGIIGVTTAYELAADGHEVTVFERRGAAAEETSFANAGLVAPGYVTPWAAPGMPGKVLATCSAAMRPSSCAGRCRRASWPGCALAQRLQARDLPGQPRAHAAPGLLQPRKAAPPDRAELQLEYDGSPATWCCCAPRRTASWCSPASQVLREAGVAFRRSTPTRPARSSRR